MWGENQPTYHYETITCFCEAKMKRESVALKIGMVLVSVAFSVFVVACNSDDDNTVNGDEDTIEQEEFVEEPPVDGDEEPLEDEVVDDDVMDQEMASEEEESTEEPEALCHDFHGAYTMTGTCDSDFVSFFNFSCVRQDDDCNLEMSVASAAFTGSANGNDLTIDSVYSMAPTSCTGNWDEANGIVDISCEIPDFIVTCDGEAEPLLPSGDIASYCCDLLGQDCGDGYRCTYVSSGSNTPLVAACLADAGTKQENETCTRGAEGVGYDDCARGFFCGNYSTGDFDSRTCLRPCDAHSDCEAGQGCMSGSVAVPRVGFCVPTCDIFGDGSECDAGTSCTMITSIDRDDTMLLSESFCMTSNSKPVGGTCSYNNDCASGLICSPFNGTCVAVCDDDHPCTVTGQECVSVSGYNYKLCKTVDK